MTRYVLRSSRPPRTSLDLDRELNDEQRAVVTFGEGAALVIAGAGSGKTRTLTYRAAHLLAGGLEPDHLLLCTFTNRAAREMTRRAEQLLGGELRLRWAGTFHRIANLALRRHASLCGLEENYAILDREDARELMAASLAEEGKALHRRRLPRSALLLHIASTARNTQRPIERVVASEAPRFVEQADDIARIVARYHARKPMLGLVDYDDLLVHFHALLREHPAAAATLTQRFVHVLVDEYQDTNRLQGEIVDLCASHHGNLTVVGDDAQSIYAFRGAHFANIMEFGERHPEARVFKLERNYRSVPEVLQLANKCIANNRKQYPKQLSATRSAGMVPALLPLTDGQQQAEFVAQRVLELHQEEDIPLGQMAVLYRAHAHSLELQVELGRRNIPFSVRSGLRFFEQAHVKDVLGYLRILHNAADPLAWQRVLRTWSGVGRRSAELVLDELLSSERARDAGELLASERLARRLPRSARRPAARLRALVERLRQHEPELQPMIHEILDGHYAEYAGATFNNAPVRLDDLVQLADYARRYESLEQMLSEVALVAGFGGEGLGAGDPPDEALTLSTIHQAKGLEWRAVFIIWLSDGRFPGALSVRTTRETEEERRLFYVAVTRARDQLYLCHPRFEDSDRGPRRILRLSRFVEELGDDGDPAYDRWQLVTADEPAAG